MLNKEFYNTIAPNYNEMVSLDKQVETKKEFFKYFVNDKTKTVIDLGCGSGGDSIALAKLGFNVTAVDPSGKMISEAEKNFSGFNVDISTYNLGIKDIPTKLDTQFDLAVAMGNTFANINKDDVIDSIGKINKLLKVGGKLIIQILNYDLVRKEKERIVNITDSEELTFIRFYDFCNDKIFFNILTFDKNKPSKRNLITTEIFPYNLEFFENALTQFHFHSLKFYGNMKFEEFDRTRSKNLIVVAKK